MVRIERRRFLQVAGGSGAAAMAGCFAFGTGCTRSYTLQLTEVGDDEIAERESQAPSDLHPVGRELVLKARDSDAATYRALRKPPVPERGYLELDGRYYGATVETVEEESVTGHVFDVTMDEQTNERGPSSTSISYADLPVHDRRAFVAGLGYPDERKLEGTRTMSGTATIGYADRNTVESSVLVPDPEYEYVQYSENYFRLEKTGTEEATVTTYELRLEHVADSASQLAARVRDESGVELRQGELSAEQRDVLRQATEDGYQECVDDSTTTYGLFERLRDADYVRYEETWYAVDLYESVE